VEHASDFAVSHATQAFPPKPQVFGPIASQSGPEQQPLGQFAAQSEQTPAEQTLPAGQSEHFRPAEPQAVASPPG
jgi:hypothetical protein